MTKHAPTQVRIAALAFLLFAAPAVFHSALGQQICTQEYAPVCARLSGNTTTYSNQCFARAAGAEVIAQGPCAVNSSPAPK